METLTQYQITDISKEDGMNFYKNEDGIQTVMLSECGQYEGFVFDIIGWEEMDLVVWAEKRKPLSGEADYIHADGDFQNIKDYISESEVEYSIIKY